MYESIDTEIHGEGIDIIHLLFIFMVHGIVTRYIIYHGLTGIYVPMVGSFTLTSIQRIVGFGLCIFDCENFKWTLAAFKRVLDIWVGCSWLQLKGSLACVMHDSCVDSVKCVSLMILAIYTTFTCIMSLLSSIEQADSSEVMKLVHYAPKTIVYQMI